MAAVLLTGAIFGFFYERLGPQRRVLPGLLPHPVALLGTAFLLPGPPCGPWADYSTRWQVWNVVRTVASGVALLLSVLAVAGAAPHTSARSHA
ncbi:hypothetical protein [Ornithinimicrobium sp.]|uniref:hypothetical protein n=1 Tax=Ornithinimicrobium sp. TaxID=1977084 RepID=UPI003D9B3992